MKNESYNRLEVFQIYIISINIINLFNIGYLSHNNIKKYR